MRSGVNNGSVARVISPAQASALLQQALQLQQSGKLEAAEALCRQVISSNQNNAEAHNILGTIYRQAGNFKNAAALFNRAAAIKPCGEYLRNVADAAHSMGKVNEAEEIYRKVLSQFPSTPYSNLNFGLLLKEYGRMAEAESSFRAELEVRPSCFDSLHNLVLVLLEEGRFSEAEEFSRQMISAKKADWRGYAMLGNTLGKQGLIEQALDLLDQAKKFVSRMKDAREGARAYMAIARILSDLEQWDCAAGLYELAAQSKADREEALHSCASMWNKSGMPDHALIVANRWVENDPAKSNAYIFIAITYQKQKHDFSAAEEWALRALSVLKEEPASNEYDRVTVDLRYSLGLTLLTFGHLQYGWYLSEWRLSALLKATSSTFLPKTLSNVPKWRGQPLDQKTILLVMEQGFGDQIQFVRYATLLKKMGATVWVLTWPPLFKLFTTFTDVDQVFSFGGEMDFSGVDYWEFMMSLPQHFPFSLDAIPAQKHYLSADPEKVKFWQQWLRNQQSEAIQRYVGIVWAGSPNHANDANRSMAFSQLLPLLDVPGIRFVSLQRGKQATDPVAASVQDRILHAGDALNDFSDSAALLDVLDLLITVDSAPAHLAGALGKPVWTLIPFVPDFRWLMQRNDSPWYPTMRLFRQPCAADWQSVVADLEEALRAWLNEHQREPAFS